MDYSSPKFNERCSKQTLDTLGYPVDYLDQCVAESFGVKTLLSSTYIDNENSIFKNDYNEIIKYKLTSFPAVVVDEKPLEGIVKENKIIVAICKAVKIKPDFCSFLTGETDEHINMMTRKKILIYILIVIVIVINAYLFYVFRQYIKEKISSFGMDPISIDGRIKNFVNNVLPFKNNQNQNDYQSLDSANNKGYNKIEGSVSTI